jgi:hypothetical protein
MTLPIAMAEQILRRRFGEPAKTPTRIPMWSSARLFNNSNSLLGLGWLRSTSRREPKAQVAGPTSLYEVEINVH